MSKQDKAEEVVKDTIFTIEHLLVRIQDMEVAEAYIAKELEEIKTNFGEEGSEGFYGGMVYESVGRAKKLLAYRSRLQGLLDRLAVFRKVQARHGITIVEGGEAYD